MHCAAHQVRVPFGELDLETWRLVEAVNVEAAMLLARADIPAALFDAVRAQQALPRTVVAEDLAGVVSFLTSDDAAMITGQALRVDGGLVTL